LIHEIQFARLRLDRQPRAGRGHSLASVPVKTREERRIREESSMATTLSSASSAHHTQFESAIPEPFATLSEQASAASESAILRAITVMIVGGIVLLGSITVWLCYGMLHYQNCL
jgi:hypothetical protein